MFRWHNRNSPLTWYDPEYTIFMHPLPKDISHWETPTHHPLESLYMLSNDPKINKNLVFHFVYVKKIDDWVSDAYGCSSVEVNGWASIIKLWMQSHVVYTRSCYEGLVVFGDRPSEFYLIPWFEAMTCEQIMHKNSIADLAEELQKPCKQTRDYGPFEEIIKELKKSLGVTPKSESTGGEALINGLIMDALAAEKL
jgi:hypothetical protein